jgi:HK97 family phage portal protein
VIQWLRKAFSRMIHAGAAAIFSLLPRTKYDYAREVGRGYGSSVVMAPVKFIQRVFPEAPLKIRKKFQLDSVVEDHALVRLIAHPNTHYSGNALWRATIACYILDGNAYWLKVRSRLLGVAELWWIPPWLMTPKHDPAKNEFITHYEYMVGGQAVDVPVSEVVHLRNGLDPRNPRLGMSDLHSVLREVFSDDEASNFTASLLRNMGVPGVIISPKTTSISATDAQDAEKIFDQRFGGDRRGKAIVMRGATDVHQFAWSPAQLELSSVRDVSEERVCAILGIPAAVVGFGSGLQQTKVGATMRELVQLAWISGIIPMQHAMAGDLENQLLVDFEGNPDTFECFFDEAMVQALQENEVERARRLDIGVRGGWIKRSEARRGVRLPVTADDEVYIMNPNMILVTPDGKPINGDDNEADEDVSNQVN